ncbi:hypothetical protein FDP41_011532 [Naegleria fowleri]|uniref:Peptidase S1 domain-containing protein n=1 Tax=Naegleria fowleri TaxID=5763 RepID=A0A6A5C6W7_NAEFO|nr:uncharacterized protein FDP41_011532 [Naegleria fowleri]KAF0982602.1 hypothetical protein FDP41_011532 [Naegleria fowleri]
MGGELASIQNYPFMVSLQSQGLHFCGGSLLNSRVILTAAHCCFYNDLETPLDLRRVRAVLGQQDLRKCFQQEDASSSSLLQEEPPSAAAANGPPMFQPPQIPPPQFPNPPPITFPESNQAMMKSKSVVHSESLSSSSLSPFMNPVPSFSSSEEEEKSRPSHVKSVVSQTSCLKVEIERMQVHPSFSVTKMTNDLALLFLKEPLDFSELSIQTNHSVNSIDLDLDWIDLQTSSTNYSHWNAHVLEIVGYGRIDGSIHRNYQLRKARVNVTSSDYCNRNGLPIKEPDAQFCVGDGNGISSCKGDSGGPLIIYHSQSDSVGGEKRKPYLIGVTSFGLAHSCGNRTKRSVFTNLLHYREWIQRHMTGIQVQEQQIPSSPLEPYGASLPLERPPPPPSPPPLPPQGLKNHGISMNVWNGSNNGWILLPFILMFIHLILTSLIESLLRS